MRRRRTVDRLRENTTRLVHEGANIYNIDRERETGSSLGLP